MAINVITPPNSLTKEQQAAFTASQIRSKVEQTGNTLLLTYEQLKALVYANKYGLTSTEVHTALGTEDTAKLRNLATAIKTLLNFFHAGAVVDAIPEGTLTFPQA